VNDQIQKVDNLKSVAFQGAQSARTAPQAQVDTTFSIQSSSSGPGQIFNSYQAVDVASKGMYGNALRANQKKPRGSTTVMMAGGDGDGDGDGDKSPFFDFKIGMLDGSGEKTMGDLTKGSKAILLVNVASE